MDETISDMSYDSDMDDGETASKGDTLSAARQSLQPDWTKRVFKCDDVIPENLRTPRHRISHELKQYQQYQQK